MKTKGTRSLIYGLCALVLLIIEVIIALFARDDFIRPYGGDILVTALLCCVVRVVFPRGIPLLPLYVFIFSVLVELAQWLDLVTLLGLEDHTFFRILIGSTFSIVDLVCYAVGCLLFFAAEWWLRRRYTQQNPNNG